MENIFPTQIIKSSLYTYLFAKYLKKVQELLWGFKKVKLRQMSRGENSHANVLANVASIVHLTNKRTIPVEFLSKQIILEYSGVLTAKEEEHTWMKGIVDSIDNGIVPLDKSKAHKLKMKSARYCIFEENLYKMSFSKPFLKFLGLKVMADIHKGFCSNHSKGWSMA